MNSAFLRRLWPLAAVAALLAVASLTAAHSSLQFGRVDAPIADVTRGLPDYSQDRAAPSASPEPRDVADGQRPEIPDWLGALATALGMALAAAVVGLLIWTLVRDLSRRRTRGAIPAEAARAPARTAQDVVAALDAGLVDLSDGDADPRRAVIACWLRLEEAAAAAGTPRQIDDTATDLVTRLLRGHHVSAAVLAEFADVYREARYATHAVDERMRAQASTALERLRGELRAGVAV
jgi:hypothetical protein